MNKSYRTVWNASLGAWVAASELTKARGRSSKSSRSAALAVAAATLVVAGYASTASAQSVGGGTATGAGTAVSANATDCNANQAVFDPAIPRPIPGASAGDTSIAIGCAADAQGGLATAIGFGALANSAAGGSSIAIGANAMATSPDASNQIAIGRNSKAARGAMALGSGTIASAPSSIAIGNQFGPGGAIAQVDSQSIGSIAIGTGSLVQNSPFASAIGSQVLLINAQNSVAIGDSARSEAARSVVVGASANSAFVDSVAIGFHAATLTPNSVAIGSNSWAEAAVPTAQGTINGVTYNYAGTDPQGSIAVGSTTNNQITSAFTRQIQAVAAGRVDANSTDGINGSQLFANQQAIEALADRAVQYNDATKTTVTLNPGGASTTVTNVAAGALNAGSTDAVNGSQLFQTNSNVTNLGTTVTNLGTTVTNLDGRVTNIDIAGTKYFQANSTLAGAQAIGADSVAIGPNAVANGNGNVALGAGSVATGSTLGNAAYLVGGTATAEVNVGGRRITGLSAGASDTDAVNVSQLRAVTAGATANAVQYDDASHTTVTLNPGGASTTVTNVAAGALNAGSTDAVNGSQLFQTNSNVTNLGTTVANLGTAVTNLDGRVTNIDIAGTKYFQANSTLAGAQAIGADSVAIGPNAVANDANSVAIGLNASAQGPRNVALGSDSTADGSTLGNQAYLVGGTATGEVNVGDRRVSGVAAGSSDDDAVNVTQLRRLRDESIRYDLNPDGSINFNSITLGGTAGGTVIHNVGPGVAGTDAVNVNQLNAATSVASSKWITANPATYAAPVASGTDSTAVGSGATSTGTNSVALGTGSNDGSRSNVVSVGSAGSERQVTNVAAGTQNTDAVNVSQLRSVTDALGGGSTIDSSTGNVIAPTYNITRVDASGGTSTATYNNVGDALGGLSTSVIYLNDAVTNMSNGGGIKYFHANSGQADSSATGAESTAMGPQASASGDGAIAAGDRSNASGSGSVAIGQQSVASGASSVAVGQGSQATNAGSVAIGLNSISSGLNTVAIGTGAVATNSVAVGAGAQAGGGGAAFGDDAIAINAIKGTALGNGANVSSAGGVALGAGAVADRAGLNGQQEAITGLAVSSTQGAVSVGSAGNERQITNVAGATQATDAVNLRQLQASQAGGVRYDTNADGSTNYSHATLGNGQAPNGTTISNVAPGVAGNDAVNVNQLNDGLANAHQYTDSKFADVKKELGNVSKDASAGTAGAMAMANLPQATIPGKGMLSAGVAGYDGQAALAIGVSKLSDNGRWVVKFSGTANSRGKVGVAAGVGFHW